MLCFCSLFATDIDECANDPCTDARTCLNLMGSFICLPQVENIDTPALLSSTLGGEVAQVSIDFESNFTLTSDEAIKIDGIYQLDVVVQQDYASALHFDVDFAHMSIARDDIDETLLYINLTIPPGRQFFILISLIAIHPYTYQFFTNHLFMDETLSLYNM